MVSIQFGPAAALGPSEPLKQPIARRTDQSKNKAKRREAKRNGANQTKPNQIKPANRLTLYHAHICFRSSDNFVSLPSQPELKSLRSSLTGLQSTFSKACKKFSPHMNPENISKGGAILGDVLWSYYATQADVLYENRVITGPSSNDGKSVSSSDQGNGGGNESDRLRSDEGDTKILSIDNENVRASPISITETNPEETSDDNDDRDLPKWAFPEGGAFSEHGFSTRSDAKNDIVHSNPNHSGLSVAPSPPPPPTMARPKPRDLGDTIDAATDMIDSHANSMVNSVKDLMKSYRELPAEVDGLGATAKVSVEDVTEVLIEPYSALGSVASELAVLKGEAGQYKVSTGFLRRANESAPANHVVDGS